MDSLEIFLIVVVLAVAFLVVQGFLVARKKRAMERPVRAEPEVIEKNLAKDLVHEIEEHFSGDTQQANALTKMISNLVTQEVQKKTVERTTELRERFERVIEEKN